LGIPIGKLVMVRPAIRLMFRDEKNQVIDTSSKSDMLLYEAIPEPFQYSNAMYGIDSGKLKTVVLAFTGKGVVIKPRLKEELRRLKTRFGKRPEKAISLQSHDRRKYLAPVLIWEKTGYTVAFVYTPNQRNFDDSVGMYILSIHPDKKGFVKASKLRKPTTEELGLFE